MYELKREFVRTPQHVVGLVQPQPQSLIVPLQAPGRIWPISVAGAPELEAMTVLYDMVHV